MQNRRYGFTASGQVSQFAEMIQRASDRPRLHHQFKAFGSALECQIQGLTTLPGSTFTSRLDPITQQPVSTSALEPWVAGTAHSEKIWL